MTNETAPSLARADESKNADASPDTSFGTTITVTPADGGALISATGRGQGGAYSRASAVIGGDITSDAGRRKIQRQAIKWIKQAFSAPKIARKPKAGAPA